VPTDERGQLTDFIAYAAGLIEQYFDLEQILAVAAANDETNEHQKTNSLFHDPDDTDRFFPSIQIKPQITNYKSRVVIAVARDPAFGFYYEDSVSLLCESGAGVKFFSPQQDDDLPEGTSGLYFGGGFPEVFAAQLAANDALLATLRRVHAAGMPIYAECGGFMYLTEGIVDLEGQFHPMAGLVPGITRMQPRLVSLGYRLVESPTGNFLLPQGITTRGHEFHWSTWEPNSSTFDIEGSTFSPAWHIRPRQDDGESKPDGYTHNNLIASYVHLHFAHDLQLPYNFVQACQKWLETA
jgi:cobyrinic acid a,c-diamide synthase